MSYAKIVMDTLGGEEWLKLVLGLKFWDCCLVERRCDHYHNAFYSGSRYVVEPHLTEIYKLPHLTEIYKLLLEMDGRDELSIYFTVERVGQTARDLYITDIWAGRYNFQTRGFSLLHGSSKQEFISAIQLLTGTNLLTHLL